MSSEFIERLTNYINRDDRIRTCGPFVPNEVRYQAALHPAGSIVGDNLQRAMDPLQHLGSSIDPFCRAQPEWLRVKAPQRNVSVQSPICCST